MSVRFQELDESAPSVGKESHTILHYNSVLVDWLEQWEISDFKRQEMVPGQVRGRIVAVCG